MTLAEGSARNWPIPKAPVVAVDLERVWLLDMEQAIVHSSDGGLTWEGQPIEAWETRQRLF